MSSDMQELLLYMSAFFMVFLSCVVVSLCLRMVIWIYIEYWRPQQFTERRQPNEPNAQNLRRRFRSDRQGNIFTISDETTGNAGGNRYPDFFYLEPSADEAARIRAQLEKDDKDLPSYDDVIRMSTPAATTVAVPSPPAVAQNVTNPNDDSDLGPPPSPPDISVPVPPYSEIDPNSATTSNNTASTSRGASVTIPIGSPSNTSA